MKKQLLAISLSILVSLGMIELACFGFFSIFHDRFTFFSAEKFYLGKDKFPYARKAYDKRYGWLKHYETPYGERPRKKDYALPLMSVYGDSYTHCDQVKHDETFEHFLSRKVKADVYNFGVGGFGTDQALLRFRTEFKALRTPIVGLGLITENINRAVNVYRKFYYLPTALSIPKPRYLNTSEGLQLLPNPLTTIENLDLLRNADFIHELGTHDYWFNRHAYPRFSFPYSGILFNQRLWLEVLHAQDETAIDDIDPRPWERLWDHEGPRELMYRIFDTFYEEAKAQGADPVILLLPQSRELFSFLEGGDAVASRSWILPYCEKKGYRCFDGIGALADSVSSVDEAKALYHGHLTPQGNRRVARALFRFLDDHGLLKKHLSPEHYTEMIRRSEKNE